MVTIQAYHAERIARTEVIGASNRGSFEAAFRSGLSMQKGWLTSGLKGIRGSHLLYGGMDFQNMDYEYNAGLKYPGDPEAEDPGEVINCRCTIVYNVD